MADPTDNPPGKCFVDDEEIAYTGTASDQHVAVARDDDGTVTIWTSDGGLVTVRDGSVVVIGIRCLSVDQSIIQEMWHCNVAGRWDSNVFVDRGTNNLFHDSTRLKRTLFEIRRRYRRFRWQRLASAR